MAIKILAIGKVPTLAMEFISELGVPDAVVTFVDRAPQAIKNIKRLSYDVILIGDRVKDGDTFDVGLVLDGTKRNRKTPVVCLGHHKGKAARLIKLLEPCGIRAEPNAFDNAVLKIKSYLQKKEERSLA